MGIVVNQSYKNIIIISIALVIGGLIPLFLSCFFKGRILWVSCISFSYLKPSSTFDFFGSQHTIIKYFSSYNSAKKRIFLCLPLSFCQS